MQLQQKVQAKLPEVTQNQLKSTELQMKAIPIKWTMTREVKDLCFVWIWNKIKTHPSHLLLTKSSEPGARSSLKCAGTRNTDPAKLYLCQHRCEVIAICVQTRCGRCLQCCMTARLSTANSEGEFMQKQGHAGGRTLSGHYLWCFYVTVVLSLHSG